MAWSKNGRGVYSNKASKGMSTVPFRLTTGASTLAPTMTAERIFIVPYHSAESTLTMLFMSGSPISGIGLIILRVLVHLFPARAVETFTWTAEYG